MRSNRDARYVTRALEFIKLHPRNHGRVELLPDHHSARSRASVDDVPARRTWVANCSCFEHLPCFSRQFIELAHRTGLGVQVWTVDTEKDATRLLEWGADALITDRPDRIVPLVRHGLTERRV